jgi:hypothetical protein
LRRFVKVLLFVLCGGVSGGLPGGPAVAAEIVPWLYEVAVPVEDQSARERERAAGEALYALLTRLTGLAYVPRTPAVLEASENAERYYSEFRYATREVPTGRALDVVFQFDTNPVLELIRTAELPIWRSTRERVLVWVVVQEGGERTIIGANPKTPLASGLEERAVGRGLPLTLPLMDLTDQLAVDPAGVWGRLSQVVDPASERYGADVLLLGRLEALPDGTYSGDWEFWVDGAVVPFTTGGPDLEAQGSEAVDVLADELALRRVVHGRQAGELILSVTGIDTPADYGGLLDYLDSLEFVNRIAVVAIRGGRLWLTVDTPADSGQLLAAFERDRRLFDDQLALVEAADLRVVWRGDD